MKNHRQLRCRSYGTFTFNLKMKLTTLFIFITLFQIQASSYSQKTKISLHLSNVSVGEVLNEIESLSEFKFFVDTKQVDLNRVISVDVKSQKISAILKKVFKGTNVASEVFDKQIILKPVPIKPIKAVPVLKKTILIPQREISGAVNDASGMPLPGVTIILLEDNSVGALTDFDGKYSIKASEGQNLQFSFVGMKTVTITVGSSNTIDVDLEEDASELDEVVVTALGIERQKKEIGYAAQGIKSAEIVQATPVDIAQGLQGKIAGLNVSTSNGLPNASSRIVIRGNTSLTGNNQPLIVIDGVITDNSELIQGNTGNNQDNYRDWGNYMSYMDMSTVESVTVLKGANAAALYGARGGNGVLLITSKKGKARDGIGIQYNGTVNVTNTSRFQDVQNEYGGGFRSALYTANPELPKTADGQSYPAVLYPWQGQYPGSTGITSHHGQIPGGYNTWDIFSWFAASASFGPKLDGTQALWYDGETRSYSPQPDNRDYMFKTGTEYVHNFSFSSASELGSIRLGVSRKEGDAVVENTDYESTSFSLGSHINISKVFSADVNAGYNINKRHNTPEIGNNNSWSKFNIYGMSREYRGLEKNTYFQEDNYDGSKFIYPGSYPYQEYSKDLFWNTYQNNSELDRDEFLGTIKLNAEISPWLRAFVRTSVDFIGTRFEKINNTDKPDGVNGGRFEKTVSKSKTFNTDLMAILHKENILTDGFNAQLTLGYNDYRTFAHGVKGINRSTFKVPNIYSLDNHLDLTNQAVIRDLSSETRYEVRSYSYFGLLDLSYNDYLFFQATGRQDTNSTLSPDINTTFYPSFNASFVFSDAFDLGNVSNWLSYGTVRASWGKSANATDPYQLDNFYDTGSFGGVTTISRPDKIPPYELTFQTNKSTEIGFALGFFQNRLNVDFTYYDMISDNQILNADISWASGANQIKFNSGELTNKGIEFIINASIIQKPDFSWNVTYNGARNVDKVVSLAPGVQELRLASVFGSLGAFIKVTPGESYGSIYGTDFELDDQGRKQVMNVYNKDGSGEVIGTQYKITSDVQKIGDASPKLTGGLNNVFRYKNFRLSALIDYKWGGDIYSVDHATAMGSGLSPATLKERNGGGLPYTFPDGTTDNVGMIMDGYNIDDNQDNDRVIAPAFYYGVTYAGWSHLNRARSLSVFENSWVKLREVTLTYDFPKSTLEKAKIFQDLSLSLIGRNLFYIYTSLPDNLNPEGINGTGNGQGLQWSQFPQMRTIGFNIKVGF